jgi:hypothetical protein
VKSSISERRAEAAIRELRRATAALEWAHARLRECGVDPVGETVSAGLTLPDCTVQCGDTGE